MEKPTSSLGEDVNQNRREFLKKIGVIAGAGVVGVGMHESFEKVKEMEAERAFQEGTVVEKNTRSTFDGVNFGSGRITVLVGGEKRTVSVSPTEFDSLQVGDAVKVSSGGFQAGEYRFEKKVEK